MAEVAANHEMSRAEVAAYLREFADELDAEHGAHGDDPTAAEGHADADSGRESDRQEGETGSAERMREERTDAADQLSDDEAARSERGDAETDDTHREGADTRDEGAHDDATRDGATRDEVTGDERAGGSTGGKVTFMVGNESATVNPPETVEFGMSVDSDSSMLSSGTRETVAFELHWNSQEVDGDDELDVQ